MVIFPSTHPLMAMEEKYIRSRIEMGKDGFGWELNRMVDTLVTAYILIVKITVSSRIFTLGE